MMLKFHSEREDYMKFNVKNLTMHFSIMTERYYTSCWQIRDVHADYYPSFPNGAGIRASPATPCVTKTSKYVTMGSSTGL